MVELFVLVHRFAGQIDSQFGEDLDVHVGEHHRGVYLAALEL